MHNLTRCFLTENFTTESGMFLVAGTELDISHGDEKNAVCSVIYDYEVWEAKQHLIPCGLIIQRTYKVVLIKEELLNAKYK